MTEARFEAAIAAFDQANAEDPNIELDGGSVRPRELVHAERLTAWVERLDPNAGEALRLAARCQHIRRWHIPRADYAEGRVGYLRWRTELGRYHADESAKILRSVGYPDDLIEALRRINMKQGLRSNPDIKTMEDALCLCFMQYELEAFATKHPDEKLVHIIKKTWNKMSPRAHEIALSLTFSERVRHLVEQALEVSPPG